MDLSKAERIKAIKESADALSDEPWEDAELVLDTFGAPEEYFDPQESRRQYFIHRLRGAPDDVVAAVCAYFDSDSPLGQAVPIAPGTWRDGYLRLFISHTNPNQKLAAEIADELRRFGVDCFVAHTMIEPTKEWMDEIERALATCDALTAILTEDFEASKWCDQEVGYVVGRPRLVIPVRQGADPHGFIGKYQAIPGDLTPFAAVNLAAEIFAALRGHDLTKASMATGMVTAYAASPTFDDARANLKRLKEIPKEMWTPEMIERAEQSAASNDNLSAGDWYGTPIPTALSQHLDQLLDRTPDTSDFADFGVAAGSDDDIPF